MALARPGVVESACLGLTALADVGAVVLSWGLRSSCDSIFFAVYGVALTAVGALVVSRLPRHPVGWILCLGGLLDAVQLATGWGLRVVAKLM